VYTDPERKTVLYKGQAELSFMLTFLFEVEVSLNELFIFKSALKTE
jgi:hypothetical protein